MFIFFLLPQNLISSKKSITDRQSSQTMTKRDSNGSSKSTILVTGGSGLVGQAIKSYVESSAPSNAEYKDSETWIFLSSKDGDLRDRKATDAIFEKYHPTHVIHLAAKVGGLFANMAQKVRFGT